MDPLLAGKVTFEYRSMVDKWRKIGLAEENRYENLAFRANENNDSKLEFILQNLK